MEGSDDISIAVFSGGPLPCGLEPNPKANGLTVCSSVEVAVGVIGEMGKRGGRSCGGERVVRLFPSTAVAGFLASK